MVMIPTDVGVQVRSQTEVPLHPVRPVGEIPGDLPELKPGQVFRAHIQEALPENTFKALVAGRLLTLSLPAGAKAGDTLELVVVDRTPHSIVAQRAEGAAGDLLELKPGQVFRAHIQEALPDNAFRAVVAGRLLTLSLPAGATVGDMLELVMIDRTPQAIVAQRAERGAGGMAEPYENATLSRTGQLIASLLGKEGGAPMPAALTRGQPLLPQAPANAAALAQSLPPQLAQAVSSSGLFYEAHQVQWAQGQRPIASLLAEPQGQHSNPATLLAFAAPGPAQDAAAKSALATRGAGGAPPAGSLLQALFGGETATSGAVAEARAPATQAAALAIPDDLRPLVQQQLDAAVTQRLAWHGEVWPRQFMEWDVERDARQEDSAIDAEPVWHTNLRLTLPRLGAIDARIRLSGQTVQLVLSAPGVDTATDLQAAIPSLQQALAGAGLTLQGVETRHGTA